MRMCIISLFVFLFCTQKGSASLNIPEGWQRPKDTLFQASWRNKNPDRFLKVGADFNCDGMLDSALLLESTTGKGIGLFVFQKKTDSTYAAIELYNSQKDKANSENLTEAQIVQIQNRFRSIYGIQLAKQGLHKTACGKGYFDCEKGEPEEVLLKCLGIDFFQFDAGGNKFFYWDTIKQVFLSQQMSD